MSNRYKGGVISATPPTTTGGEDGTASGAWTLEQQMQLTAAGLWPIQPLPKYIEDVFSTYLYTGNGSTQTITNNIDLSTKGGLVWIKSRTAYNHNLFDTTRGVNNRLFSNTTAAQTTTANSLTAFNTNGFSLGGIGGINDSADLLVSWTFREQPKFFDIVTWTGNGSTQTINHNLGSTPGCVIIKQLNAVSLVGWVTYHRSVTNPNDNYLLLNTTDAPASAPAWISPNSTSFTVGNYDDINKNGNTYVAYLWAHDAGGFGTSGTDNVISCGSFTAGTGSINLGYEPQWIMFKGLTGANEWIMFDTMRGWPTEAPNKLLMAQSSAAEGDTYVNCQPTATGFNYSFSPSCIYIAIRKGPMAVPTVGTSVFSPNVATTTIVTNTVLPSAGFPVDLMFFRKQDLAYSTYWNSRLLPDSNLQANASAAEITGYPYSFASMTSVQKITNDWFTGSAIPFVFWQFRRAPSFFDQVCYTGDSSDPKTVPHNLGKAPELMIFKARAVAAGWRVWGGNMAITEYLALSETSAVVTGSTFFGSTLPTATSFYVGSGLNTSGRTIVAYLFATAPGVSKVGSYTGTGAAQTINCGFTSGSRFVLIKRTDSTGDWYLWDSARGIIPSNDPYVVLNTDAAPVTGTDYVDTTNVGFDITSTAPAAINANGGTFIFLAIA